MVEALQQLASWKILFLFILGTLNGMATALLPGLSGSVGLVLMIPLAFRLTELETMVLFASALGGQNFAGSITAIILNAPGAAPNAATTFDGYPLARQGKAGFAIGISAAASALGSVCGVAALILLLPLARQAVLAFSYPEFTLLTLIGLICIAAASRGALLKGLVSGGLGVLLSLVGLDPMTGEPRYTFGLSQLYEGISVTAALVGLFGLAEVLQLLVRGESVAQVGERIAFSHRQLWEGVVYTVRHLGLVVRSSLVGIAAGIIPGLGGTVASFMAYYQAAQTARDRSRFGKGDPRGVLAPEAANDAKEAASALPSLAFGIPATSEWAIVLGAFVMHGIIPGPLLVRDNIALVWTVIWVILAASWTTSLLGLLVGPQLARVTQLRPGILAPVVVAITLVGTYASEKRFIEVLFAVAFALLGYVMRELNIPLVPLVLGLVLGENLERNFYHTMEISDIGPLVFFIRPICITMILLIVFIIVVSWVASRRRRVYGEASVAQL